MDTAGAVLGQWRFDVMANGNLRVQRTGGTITIGANYPGGDRRPGTLVLMPTDNPPKSKGGDDK